MTREPTAAIVGRWQDKLPQLRVEYRDLDANPLPPVRQVAGPGQPRGGRRRRARNGTVPGRRRAGDRRAHVQPFHSLDAEGLDRSRGRSRQDLPLYGKSAEGLAGGKKIIIASGRGGIHTDSPTDFQEAYLRQVFGFLGVTDIEFVRAEGVAYSPQHRSDAIAGALASIPEPLRLAA